MNDNQTRLNAYRASRKVTPKFVFSNYKAAPEPAPKPADSRSFGSKLWDTVNPLDSGRTWSNPNPVNSDNIVEQAAKNFVSAQLGGFRSAVGTAQDLSGLVDLVTPGKGNSRVTNFLTDRAEELDAAAKYYGGDPNVYRGAQGATDVGTFLIPGAVATKVGKIPKITGFISKASKVPVVGKILTKFGPKLANVGVDAAQGAGFRSARGEDVSLGTTALDVGISAGTQGIIDLSSAGLKRLAGFLRGEADPVVVRQLTGVDEATAELIAKSDSEDEIVSALEKIRMTPEVNLRSKEAVKNPVVAKTATGISADPLSTTIESLVKNTNQKEVNTLLDELVPGLKRGDSKRLAQRLASADSDEAVADILVEAVNKSDINRVPLEKLDANLQKNTPTSISEISKLAKNSFENSPEGIKPGGIERAMGEIDNAKAKPVRVRRTPEGDLVIEDGRHRIEAARRQGIDDFPVEDVTESYSKQNTGTSTPEAPNTQQGAPSDVSVASEVNKNADEASKVLDAPQDVQTTVQEIKDSMGDIKAVDRKNRKLYAKQRAEKVAMALKNAEGLTGTEKIIAQRKAFGGALERAGWQGVLPDLDPAVKAEKMEAVIEHLLNTQRYADRPFEQSNLLETMRRVFGIPGEDGVIKPPTPGDIKRLAQDFDDDFANTVAEAIEDSKSVADSIRDILGDLSGVPKGLMATLDLSYGLRQGAPLGSRFPKEWLQAQKEAVKFVVDPKYMDDTIEGIRDWKDSAGDDIFELLNNEMKIEMSAMGIGEEAVAGVESLKGRIFNKLKTDKKTVDAIEKWDPTAMADRAYSGAATMQRALVAKNIIDKFGGVAKMKETLDPKAIRDLGKVINSSTGAGEYGNFQKYAPALGKTLFSPRLWKSKLDMINPAYYVKLSPEARKLALQTNGAFLSVVGAVLSAAAAAGATVEKDPRSSDFMKIKVGNTRYDVMGGLQQNLVLISRLITNSKKNSETGEVQTLGEDFGGPTRSSVFTDFLSNKSNPLIGTAFRIATGKDRGGNEINPWTELAKLFIPLGIQGTYETTQDTGSLATGVGANIPGFFGVGVQTYGNTPTKNQAGTPEAPKWKGDISDDMVTDKSGNVVFDKNGKPVRVKFDKNATDLEKQALKDDKRRSALREQYKANLSTEDQALLKLDAGELKEYADAGAISKETYDRIEQYRNDIDNIEGVEIPDGVKSTFASEFYRQYNGMPDSKREEFLDGPATDEALSISYNINKDLPKGVSKLRPSNRIALAYADYENDLNTKNWNEVEKRNELRKFVTKVVKENRQPMVQDIYTEGGSDDLKYLMSQGAITKDELDMAIQLDNELYSSGLTGSLKFSKKFRNEYGYATPSNQDGSGGGGSGSGVKINLASLFPKSSTTGSNKFKKVSVVSRTYKKPEPKVPSGSGKKISISL